MGQSRRTAIGANAAHKTDGSARGDNKRGFVIGLVSFFTLVDLFAAQAILPTLALEYEVDAASMGTAVNASTLGMAAAGLIVALFSKKIDRRAGVWSSLAILSVPTLLLAYAPDVTTFAALRIVQGVFMATAFTLTMAYLAEECTAAQAAGAMAAYITGNVASNLFGRLVSASIVGAAGLQANFFLFAALNLAGAALAYFSFTQAKPRPTIGFAPQTPGEMRASWLGHLVNPPLAASFAIGFLILFAFIGVFTYVNFVLIGKPFGLAPAALGLVYLVFIPAMISTPFAGKYAAVFGVRSVYLTALAVSAAGLVLTLFGNLLLFVCGLALIAAGLFFAQAVVTAFVGRAAIGDRTSASGLYLGCYYFGGLVGSVIVGAVFSQAGWFASVLAVGGAIILAAWLGRNLVIRAAQTPSNAENPLTLIKNRSI